MSDAFKDMDLCEFMHYYLNPQFEKLAKEQKTVFVLGDFNVDLLKYEQHKATNEFLDSLSSNQLGLLTTQRLSLIIYFPIISLKI